VCEVGTRFSIQLFYYFVRPRCILFPYFNIVLCVKQFQKVVIEIVVLLRVLCVLEGFKFNILVVVL